MTGWTEEGLISSWRALATRQGDEEWRLVNLAVIDLVTVQAGRHFPDSREALVVAFPAGWLGKVSGLPDGKGFEAALIEGNGPFYYRCLHNKMARTIWAVLTKHEDYRDPAQVAAA